MNFLKNINLSKNKMKQEYKQVRFIVGYEFGQPIYHVIFLPI